MSTCEGETNTSEQLQVRSSSRERSLTEKGKEMQEQETKKHERSFNKAYESWKVTASYIRNGLKRFCSSDELNNVSHDIRAKCDLVKQNYEPIRRNQCMSQVIVKRMDTCNVITSDICELIQKRIATIEETFNDHLEKERVRLILSKKEHGSVFGDTETETFIPVAPSISSDKSCNRVDAEAELAAREEQASVTREILAQEAKLTKMESDWKMKELETKTKIEEEKTKLQQLKADSEVKVAAARVRVYNGQDVCDKSEVSSQSSDSSVNGHTAAQNSLNPQAPTFQPQTSSANQEFNLAQALASSLTLNRLPLPEPATFSGDPLKYMDWKVSFMALIGSKPLPVCEKMLYLKSYLAGDAKKAVEGFFYRNTEQAYQGIWNVLQERYGSPFMVQRAFRTKLMKWPKINANDPLALREFTDFLQSCAEAVPQVKGLEILNDCEENHKLLKKLPDWIVQRWSRIVVDEMDKRQEYPSFTRFTEFMQKETKVACNPIASPFLMNEKATEERYVKRAKALTTTAQTKSNISPPLVAPKPKRLCLFCRDDAHGIVKCTSFAAKTMDEKTTFIRENHLCFGCLRKGHVTKECKARHSCGKCGRRHPTCLHTEKPREPKQRVTENVSGESANKVEGTNKPESTNKEVHKVMAHVLTRKTSATSSIVPVFVSTASKPQKEILTYALLDTQSDSSFILGDLASELNVDSEPVQLKLSTMTSVDTVVASKLASNLQVRGFDCDNHVVIQHAYSRDFIPVDKSHIPTRETALQWPHLKALANKMRPLQDCDVGLLIGYDCPVALAPLEVVTGNVNEPLAQRTILGWSVIGSANPHLDRQSSQSCVHRITVKEILTPSANDVLKVLESDFNERNYEDKYVSQDDVRFIQLLSDTIAQRTDGHLEMPLPFKDQVPPDLPNNKKLATVRLQHLKKRLKADKQYHEHYTAFMRETISSGDAELAPLVSEGETVWYIPHHGVYHPKKPTKLRVVFDCSAKFLGISLNDKLLTGPDMTNSLMGVLCRFRRETVAIICDIQKMFHQFFVSTEMRNYLRFLWWENGQLDTEPKEYRMAVHLFGAGSSPACANFGLKYLAKQHRFDYPKAADFVEKNFYVDDGLISVPSVNEAKELITEAQQLCKQGGLRLHKFNSNHSEALSHLEPSERADTTEPLNLKPDSTSEGHVLGIQWSIENDTFSFNTNTKEQTPTRRSILSVISSLFDPLGFLAPFVLSGKSILQELCRRGIGWDDPIPENLRLRWEEWKNGLQTLKTFTVPRCYHPPDLDNIVRVELHHFSDASNIGYGTCSYLRYKNDRDRVHCSLVIAKARVAPTKITSIPRLELSAAVISAKISVMLKEELEMHIDKEYFWTDSQVVLAYINNEARRFHVFVANRVQLIRQTTDPKQWHYIDTAQNPADYASRGLNASDLILTSWLTGPKFLWESDIPFAQNNATELLVGDPEVKSVKVLTTHTSKQSDILSRLNRFSSWTMLLKVIARIKRLRSKQTQNENLVTVEERKRAAETVISLLQQHSFPQELEKLKVGENLSCSSPLFSLDPVLDRGLLRVGGRLNKSTLGQELKHPIILPKDHHITRLIMSHYHSKVCHQGRSQTLMELRANGFWVMSGSKQVAKLITKCVQCRKLRRPTEEQRMSELPKERVEASEPFVYCGMDCFGPFIIKQGRKEHKRYGLLFTCLSSRAVHIEMLEDLSTDSFINALRCFISLRGAVSRLYCDQGTNFVGAKNELREALKQCDSNAIEVFLADKQCEFIFNAPSASHAGGVWERQIRTIRNVLNVTLVQSSNRLDDASLRMLFYEAMSIINGRPLNVNSINDPKSLEPITPNNLILMKSKVALPPPGKFVKEDVYARKRWRRVQYLAEQFWSRWKREYLLNISTRQKWHVPRRNVKVNDIVIIKEEMLPRSQWHLGRVVETSTEDDGLVRRVKVQTADRNPPKKQGAQHKPHVVERPIQKLVVLLESN